MALRKILGQGLALGGGIALAALAASGAAAGERINEFERPIDSGAHDFFERNIDDDRDDRLNRTQINMPGGPFSAAAIAIGNQIAVQIDGNGNTVVINAEQVNNGNQTAIVSLNGKLNFNGWDEPSSSAGN